MSLYDISNKNTPLGRKRSRNEERYWRKIWKFHNRKGQFIGFLSGAGGTGKSKVIHLVRTYCKMLCDELNIEFNKRTIVTTALTGTAAVSINGETTARACKLKSKSVSKDEFTKRTIVTKR